MLYGEDATVDVDALRDGRPRSEVDISSRNCVGARDARCEMGTLLSLKLLSPRGLFTESFRAVHSCFFGSNLGMRLMLVRMFEEFEVVLLEKEGTVGTGDPEDLGSDTQSSDKESSHA